MALKPLQRRPDMRSLILATVVTVTSSTAALAVCADRDAIIASLSKNYSEKHLASGFQSSAGLMEIWVSEPDGTWTILMTQPNGMTCIMASGTHWLEEDAMPLAGEPA
jgi:hypothetical protein